MLSKPQMTGPRQATAAAIAAGASGGGIDALDDDVAAVEEDEAFEVGMRQNAMEYSAADADNDNKLDFGEFCVMVREREAHDFTEAQLRFRFEQLDADRSGKVDMSEYTAQPPPPASLDFVRTVNGQLVDDGAPFRFVGLNMWQAVWLAATNAPRLRAELDLLRSSGVTVLRIVALSEGAADAPLQASPSLQPRPGEFDERMAAALDLVMVEVAVRLELSNREHSRTCLSPA